MEAFKDRFFNRDYVQALGTDIQYYYNKFDVLEFVNSVLDSSWNTKELKERMYHISTKLHEFIKEDYPTAISILSKVAEQKIKEKRTEAGDLVFADFVEKFGIEHFEISVKALELFTQTCTSEFAVRPFIVHYPEKMMRKMLIWAEYKNPHIRRLASEGCRSRLPWAMALPQFKIDPTPILPILELLKNDESEYVRKSVSNNLNDISKDHPELVLKIANAWYGQNNKTDRLVKHALRTLLKKGNPNALRILNIHKGSEIEILHFSVDKTKINLGEKIQMQIEISTKEAQKIRIEYKIHFKKSRGNNSAKIFQWFQGNIFPENTKLLNKVHHFKDHSTRKHFDGEHFLELVVNGEVKASCTLELIC